MGRRYYRRRKGFRVSKKNFWPFVFATIVLFFTAIEYAVSNPEIIIFAIVLLGLYIHYKYRTKIRSRSEREEQLRKNRTVDQLLSTYNSHPTDFEKYVAEIYNKLGYKTEVTKSTGDGGKDIIMFKNNKKYVVEVKLYSKTRKIGRGLIQKFHSVMIDSNADEAIFVTTSDFASTSKEYASKHGIKLINGDNLVELIDKALETIYSLNKGEEEKNCY